jgi:glycosyltransferase involved in cell wall biosynthesis
VSESKAKHKIVYVIGSLRRGGAERHLVELMKAIDRTRFEPKIYCLGQKDILSGEVEALGITVKEFGFLSAGKKSLLYKAKESVLLIWRMMRSIRQDRPHIVHTYLFWANTFGAAAAKLAGTRLLITSRRSLGLYKDGKPYLQWIENMTNVFTDRITTNSKEVYEDSIRREKFIHGKTALIYNGVDERFFMKRTASGRPIRKELAIPDDHVVVTNVSNLIPYKGHKEFVEAASIVLERYRNVTFLLVGRDGGMYEALTQQSRSLGIGDRVLFLGGRGDIVDILNETDIQVLCSYQEGFSNAVLEGMSCSLPLVVTRVGGNAEAVIDGHNGLVVPPRDGPSLAEALLRLVPDRGLRVAMGENGRHRVEELFTVKGMAANYKQLYMELMGEPWRLEREHERLSAEAGR